MRVYSISLISRLPTRSAAAVLAMACAANMNSALADASTVGSTRAETAKRVFIDSAGRQIAVPERIERAFAADLPTAIIFFSLAPDELVGWSRKLRDEEAAFIPAQYRKLPVSGSLTGRGNTADVATLRKAEPDVVIDYTSDLLAHITLADRVQERTGIPYILLDGTFRNIPQTYRLLGRLLARPKEAERLAVYAEGTLAEVGMLLRRIPRDRRPRVYYGRGPGELESGPSGSAEVIEAVGAVNVAAQDGGPAKTPMERILKRAPDAVLTSGPDSYASIFRDASWRDVAAVRNGRVYLAPDLPFGWLDRPPSVNRLMGVKWLVSVLYPDYVKMNLRQEARQFYRLFYHIDLDDRQLDRLLLHATGDMR